MMAVERVSDMKKKILYSILLISIFINCRLNGEDYFFKKGKGESNYWIKTIGAEKSFSYAPSVIVTNDGFIEIGYSSIDNESFDFCFDFCIVKLDKNCNLVYSQLIGTKDSDKAYTINKTTDGGYFIVGFVESPEDESLQKKRKPIGQSGEKPQILNPEEMPKSGDILVIKLKKDMSIEWGKLIDTGTRDVSNSGRQTKDGGYVISGSTEINGTRDAILIKLNKNGVLEWAKTIGGKNREGSSAIEITPDNGFVIAGITFEAGSVDTLIAKLNENGELKWAKAVGGGRVDSDNWDGVRITKDGGYILGGESDSFGRGKELSIVKLNKDGIVEWSKVIGGDGDDACWTVTPTSDGGYIAGGRYQVEGDFQKGNMDIPVIKLDRDGNLIWATIIGDPSFQEIEEIKEVEDGYVLAGVTSGKFFIAKLNKNGLIPGSKFTRMLTPKISSSQVKTTSLNFITTDITSKLKITSPTLHIKNPYFKIEEFGFDRPFIKKRKPGLD